MKSVWKEVRNIAAILTALVALISIGTPFYRFLSKPKVEYESLSQYDTYLFTRYLGENIPEEYVNVLGKGAEQEGSIIRIKNLGHSPAEEVCISFDSSYFFRDTRSLDYLEGKYGSNFLSVSGISVSPNIEYKTITDYNNHTVRVRFESIPPNVIIVVKYKPLILTRVKIVYEQGEAKMVDLGTLSRDQSFSRFIANFWKYLLGFALGYFLYMLIDFLSRRSKKQVGDDQPGITKGETR